MALSVVSNLALGEDARRLVAAQAHHCHHYHARPDYLHTVGLPSTLMAHLLRRTCPAGADGYTYLASADDDTVSCGLHPVWKTGGRAVYDYVLKTATERELALYDLVETYMWASHEVRRLRDGPPPLPEHRPRYVRWGQPVATAPWLAFPGEWTWMAARVAALQAEVEQLWAVPAPADAPAVTRETLEAWAAALKRDTVICTHAALAAAQAFGGQVWGYLCEDNPQALAGRAEGGHDFALVGERYLVDVWRLEFEDATRAVYDLVADATEVERIYGPRDRWERVPDEAQLEVALA